eukprot:GFKZ01010422.1.p1 GENE.GFKZ01010422.1~~GFKZ01010422.1.p1  ORF type:complete len:453 (+),score=72.98 GFKZ01010422.1:174-1532(+)
MEPPPASFDLDVYASRYEGRTKIQRLQFIASRSAVLRPDALRMAVHEAKKGCDTALYKEILHQADGLTAPEFVPDQNWIVQMDQAASRELTKLRGVLEEKKQRTNKEVIRTGHTDLGDFFHQRGKLQQARGDYTKTRDYCINAAQHAEMCLKVITVSVQGDEFSHVENHCMLAEDIPEVDKTSLEMVKMRACAGLSLLVRGSYGTATSRFLEVNTESSEEKVGALQKEFGDIVALEDVATYGALCALATLDRAMLTKQVMEREEFRALLELVPDVREVVNDFYHSRYTRCLETLARIRGELMLDMYLGREDHVENLYRLIRRKAIMQYVSPFLSADLHRMARVFGTTVLELEEELLVLIENGSIAARIDTQNGSLHAKQTNVRLKAIGGAVEKGVEAFEEAEAMLLRMTLMKNKVGITAPNLLRPGGTDLGVRGRSVSSIADNVFDRRILNN